ncbi:MAG: C10 family peptidase [Muribaculaceae bacterium]|nr:C10 family peptidase [Muribaculaceae bacterium]
MRFIFLFLYLLTFSSVFSRYITPEIAYQRCISELSVFRGNGGSLSVRSDMKVKPIVDRNGEIRLYIIDEGGSFIVASADDEMRPLLGYSETQFPTDGSMPPALAAWLDFYAEEISSFSNLSQYVQENGNSVNISAVASGAELPSIGKLISSIWNQRSPYNDKCPVYNDKERCCTGCVATAVAQIMYYYRYPERGQGIYTHTDTIRGKEYSWTVDFGNTEYHWEQMTPQYTAKSSAASKEAVAILMQQLGVAVKMDYDHRGVNQSGAKIIEAARGLIRNFNYDKGSRYELRSYYSDDEWRQLLHSELSSGRPILYEGNSPENSSGHAFICDGYDSKSDKFHFNWGWGGNGDGFYSLSALKPNTKNGVGAGNYNYTANQAAIIGIHPPEGDNCYYPLLKIYSDISVLKPLIATGASLGISVGESEYKSFYNFCVAEEKSKFVLGLELRDKKSGEIFIISSDNIIELNYRNGARVLSYNWKNFTIPRGDYTARPVVRICNGEGIPQGNWEYIRQPYGTCQTLDMHVGNHYITAHNETVAKPLLQADKVEVPAEADYINDFIVEAEVSSRYADYKGGIAVVALEDGDDYPETVGKIESVEVSCGKVAKLRIACRLTKQMKESFELCLKSDDGIFNEGNMVRVTESEMAAAFTPDNEWPKSVVPDKAFRLGGEFRSDNMPYRGYVKCRILDSEGKVVCETLPGNYVTINVGGSQRVVYNFDGISEKGLYTVELMHEKGILKVESPLIVRDMEFKVEVDSPIIITDDDWSIDFEPKISLISGGKYSGYINYELSNAGGYSEKGSSARYLSLEEEETKSVYFYIRTKDLETGDYLLSLFLCDGVFDEEGQAVGDSFLLRKVNKESLGVETETADSENIFEKNGRIVIENAVYGSPVKIFSSDGKLVYTTVVGNSVHFEIAYTCAPGVYVVVVGNKAVKLIRH